MLGDIFAPGAGLLFLREVQMKLKCTLAHLMRLTS